MRAAHRFEPLEVLIDGTRADGAPAGERDLCVTEPRHERSEDEHARAHLLHELVRRLRTDARARLDVDHRSGDLHVASEEPQERRRRVDVAQGGHVPEATRAVGQERRAEDGERRVLGAADLHGAAEGAPGADADCVHPSGLPEFRPPAK